MQTKYLKIELTKEDIELLLSRYHFKDTDFFKVSALYQTLLPLLRTEAAYVRKEQTKEIAEKEFFIVFLTLGKLVDELQDLYSENECVSEAYMIECLAMELLKKAYEEAVREIQKESGKWVAALEFLGDRYPLELLPELEKEVGQTKITYNENFVLSPRKSVVMFLPVTDSQVEDVCHICTNCGNVNCSYREKKREEVFQERDEKYRDSERRAGTDREGTEQMKTKKAVPYGYQRIFGKKAEDGKNMKNETGHQESIKKGSSTERKKERQNG